MYVVTLSVFHNLAIWLLYVNKPELELDLSWEVEIWYTGRHLQVLQLHVKLCFLGDVLGDQQLPLIILEPLSHLRNLSSDKVKIWRTCRHLEVKILPVWGIWKYQHPQFSFSEPSISPKLIELGSCNLAHWQTFTSARALSLYIQGPIYIYTLYVRQVASGEISSP